MSKRDKIEQIIATKTPTISFQLVRLVKLEDWIAYIQNLITLGLKVSAVWRMVWTNRLYCIVQGTFGATKMRMITEVKDNERELAYYFVANILRFPIRDKGIDEILMENSNDMLMG